mgnify:CR=1 FL=1
MSNNKQSSLDYYITKSTEILGTEIIKQISRDDNERIARLEKQAKEMEKEQIIDAYYQCGKDNFEHIKVINRSAKQYYNETFGGNNEND